MFFNLEIRIIFVPKFKRALSPLLFSVTYINFLKFQVRTVECRLAGPGNPSSPSVASAAAAATELPESPRRQRENLA